MKGGRKLAQILVQMEAKAKSATEVQVGFMSGSTYPDGTSVPMVAAIQEFGAPAKGIPPRPYFRHMVDEKSPNWGKSLGHLLTSHNYDAKKAMALMGEGIGGQLRASIIDLTDPALAQETVSRKGFSKPLIDTGHMLNSVQYRVDEGGAKTAGGPSYGGDTE